MEGGLEAYRCQFEAKSGCYCRDSVEISHRNVPVLQFFSLALNLEIVDNFCHYQLHIY